MITISDLNKICEKCELVGEYRNKLDYFKKVVAYWEKKAARKNAAEIVVNKYKSWTRVVENWTKMAEKSQVMYPSIYMGCAWVMPLDIRIGNKEYTVAQVYEPKRTNDSSTHWGWGIDDGHGNLIQQWPSIHSDVTRKDYETADEFIADFWADDGILDNLMKEENEDRFLASYERYYTPEKLIECCGEDGLNA